MRVTLDNRGNPDLGQDADRRLRGTRRVVVDVRDFRAASEAAVHYRDANGLGGGNWVDAEVREGDALIGKVAYNGVVFPPGTWHVGVTALHDPRPPRPVDPYTWERAEVRVPGVGLVTVTGSLRTGTWSVTDPFGHLPEALAMGRLHFDADGTCAMLGVERTTALSATLDTIGTALREWYASPEGRALVLANQVRDRYREMSFAEEHVGRLREELAAAETKVATASAALQDARDDLDAARACATPSP